MSKLKLGNDFSDDGEKSKPDAEESDEKTLGDESEDENENSSEADDGKNNESSEDENDSDATDDDESEDDKSEEEDDSKDDGKKDDKKPTKDQELQGLLDTEKDLDTNLSDIDKKIKEAKDRISAKRKARREGRDLVETVDEKLPDTEEETDDLSDIDDETIKVLERFTKAKGLVPKSELIKESYQKQHKSAEASFYEAHPEYSAENDTDDALYNALKEELADFAAPSDAAKIPKIFEKAHQAVTLRYPDRFKKKDSPADKKQEDKKNDQTNKSVRLKNQSLGGGNSGGSGKGSDNSGKSEKASLSQLQIDHLRDGGWSDEDIKELQS